VDVHYEEGAAVAACLVFKGWERGEAAREHTKTVAGVAEYVAGEFYKRELPCVLAVLGEVAESLEIVVVDGYVWLGQGRRGLGAYLHEALGGDIAVVGVAKSEFAGYWCGKARPTPECASRRGRVRRAASNRRRR
jgi:deoxyribonuclease V